MASPRQAAERSGGIGVGIGTVAIVGASGLIGAKVVAELRARGHRVLAASRSHGVDTFTGRGLDDTIREASVVVDVTNPGGDVSTDPVSFFSNSTRNLLAAETRLGVSHHLVLSIVGTNRLADTAGRAGTGAGYFQAKRIQEELVRASGIPFTIIRSTQFFEFVPVIAEASRGAATVSVPPAFLQPVAADDVAKAVADAALAPPTNATIEVAGPARLRFDQAVELVLGKARDQRPVLADPAATYFGVPIEPHTLLPGPDAKLGLVTFQQWMGATNPNNDR